MVEPDTEGGEEGPLALMVGNKCYHGFNLMVDLNLNSIQEKAITDLADSFAKCTAADH